MAATSPGYPRLHDLIEEAAETIAGRRPDSGLEDVRAHYPTLYALIEATGTITGGAS